MSILRRIIGAFSSPAASTPAKFCVDPERDGQRLRLIVADGRRRGEAILNPEHLWQEMSDGLYGSQHRPIGTDKGGIEEREWMYGQLMQLVKEGKLIEDPDHHGPYGQFWHTSSPIARMINAAGEFRIAMELTERQLEDEGHTELLELLTEAKNAMIRLKNGAKEYSRSHGVYAHGETSTHYLSIGPEGEARCICGETSDPYDSRDQALAWWRQHVPTARP